MKHPHDTLIRAWLDGQAVQYLDPLTDLWVDLQPPDKVDKLPHFYLTHTYRLKPINLRVRQALMRLSAARFYVATANSLEEERQLAGAIGFVRWLGDWVEVEV